jgi:hypothetical protein
LADIHHLLDGGEVTVPMMQQFALESDFSLVQVGAHRPPQRMIRPRHFRLDLLEV